MTGITLDKDNEPPHRPLPRYEVPVMGRLDDQNVAGRIDLLAQTDKGFVIVDPQSFLGQVEQWSIKALSYRPQMEAYRRLVEQASGHLVLDCLIHMPIAGVMIRLF